MPQVFQGFVSCAPFAVLVGHRHAESTTTYEQVVEELLTYLLSTTQTREQQHQGGKRADSDTRTWLERLPQYTVCVCCVDAHDSLGISIPARKTGWDETRDGTHVVSMPSWSRADEEEVRSPALVLTRTRSPVLVRRRRGTTGGSLKNVLHSSLL